MRRRRPWAAIPHRDRWLVSYADLVTLLFGLFVVLYAMSSMNREQWRQAAEGVRAAFAFNTDGAGGLIPGLPVPSGSPGGAAAGEGRDASAFSFLLLRQNISAGLEHAQGEGQSPAVHIRPSDRGLLISLASQDFFEAGGTTIQPGAIPSLDSIGAVLATSDLPLRIEGHTDDRPISSARFPSNWELSTARAAAVTRYLIETHHLSARRIGAAGFADNRPIVPNDSDENRALNRRIDIVVLASGSAAREEPDAPDRESLEILLEQLPPLEE